MSDLTEKIDKIKKEAEEYYKSIGKVFCPYLNKDVNFNTKGLDHIKMKEWNKARPLTDQYLRLRLLKLVPKIIKISHTLQDLQERKNFERQNINSRWENRMVSVQYYGFISIVNGARIKIVVKHIAGGQPYFWSVIPFWKTKNDPITGQLKKILCEGDLEKQ